MGFQVGAECIYVAEYLIRRRGLAVLLAHEQHAVGLALQEHVDDILMFQVAVLAQFTHRSQDITIPLEGIDGCLHRGGICIVGIHHHGITFGLQELRAVVARHVGTDSVQGLRFAHAEIASHADSGRYILGIVAANEVGTLGHHTCVVLH